MTCPADEALLVRQLNGAQVGTWSQGLRPGCGDIGATAGLHVGPALSGPLRQGPLHRGKIEPIRDDVIAKSKKSSGRRGRGERTIPREVGYRRDVTM